MRPRPIPSADRFRHASHEPIFSEEKPGPLLLSLLLALTLTLSLALATILVPRLIALLILLLHDGVSRLVTVALLIELTLLLHLPGILVP